MTRRPTPVPDPDEKQWWDDSDHAEPLMGVPSAASGVAPEPLPDTAPGEPEPGVEPEQEAEAGLGFAFTTAGEP